MYIYVMNVYVMNVYIIKNSNENKKLVFLENDGAVLLLLKKNDSSPIPTLIVHEVFLLWDPFLTHNTLFRIVFKLLFILNILLPLLL